MAWYLGSNKDDPTVTDKILPKIPSGKKDTKNSKLNEYQLIISEVKTIFGGIPRSVLNKSGKASMVKFDKMYPQLLDMLDSSSILQQAVAERDRRLEELEEHIANLQRIMNEEAKQKELLEKQVELGNVRLSPKPNSPTEQGDASLLHNVGVSDHLPFIIAGEYESLCQNQWQNAKDILDKEGQYTGDGDKMAFLRTVLEVAETEAIEAKNRVVLDVQQILMDPVDKKYIGKSHNKSDKLSEIKPASEELSSVLADVMSQNTSDTNIQTLIQNITEAVKAKFKKNQPMWVSVTKGSYKDYISMCARICWKMTLQRPRMRFITEGIGDTFNAKVQEPYLGCIDPRGSRSAVKFYVHPTLYYGDQVLLKGKVMIERI